MEAYGLNVAMAIAGGVALFLTALAFYAAFRGREEDYVETLPEPQKEAFERIEQTHADADLAHVKTFDKL